MFLLFGYDNYYPNGGANDLIGKGETLEDLIKLIETEPLIKGMVETLDVTEAYDLVNALTYSYDGEKFILCE